MTSKARQQSRYTLTPQGCLATGGHSFVDGVCGLCGTEEDTAGGDD